MAELQTVLFHLVGGEHVFIAAIIDVVATTCGSWKINRQHLMQSSPKRRSTETILEKVLVQRAGYEALGFVTGVR
jgi:hypothetical protein